MDQGQAGGLEDLIHELIPDLAVGPAMAAIVQFDPAERFQRCGVAQQEIHMLPVDPGHGTPVRVGPGDEEQVPQVHLENDGGASVYRRNQGAME